MYASRGRLAQLVRASRLHREGRGFEALTAHSYTQWYDGNTFEVWTDGL